ncbi:MAG: GGDEF domain-containing protein [Gemmatimonadota bacterium]
MPFTYSRRKSRAALDLPAMPAPRLPAAWLRIFSAPDPLLVDAGADGELLVAKIRLGLVSLLLLIPVFDLTTSANDGESYVGLGITLAATLMAVAVYILVKRDFYRPWIGFATSLFDVTFVSGALTIFLVIGSPHTAVNSKVAFEGYFLAIGATALRYDPRICVVAGLLALSEYAAIVLYAGLHWNLNDPSFAPFAYGMFSWSAQLSRMVILGIAVVLSTTIVLRTQALRRLSRSDRLTGLPNRAYFDERVMSEISRARRYGHPLAMAMIDVDHFKLFNDTYGHAAGDEALRIVASTIQKAVRDSDLVVRYGGEEFVAVFPGMNADGAVERMEAIRRAVSETPVPLLRTQQLATLTISAGVSTYGVDSLEVDELLDAADNRLFEAKEAGRNRVVGGTGAVSERR